MGFLCIMVSIRLRKIVQLHAGSVSRIFLKWHDCCNRNATHSMNDEISLSIVTIQDKSTNKLSSFRATKYWVIHSYLGTGTFCQHNFGLSK